MKKTFVMNLLIILATYFLIVLISSCKKEKGTDEGNNCDNNPACSSAKPVAEEINLFLANNARNTDIL